ncbi:M1 family aminopeptidase [Hymenobacter gelipurpurascens]|uniref:M1 family aminopeptidase n=1 Tax=Hymenobacter gelipurpurascens TaxID=89968 RepID=UPI0029372CCE|nr:M1 family aminopeptidase [Hymenobacter gelipurpurascens]
MTHKWWSSGSFNDYNDWLNEAFAVYSSLLYIRSAGDTATYNRVLAKHTAAAAGAPALIGFQKEKYDYPTYRRVVYSKGTVVLAALHQRLGNEKFLTLLAATAAQKTATTEAFLALVEQTTGAENRAWLLALLKH